jgi:hypothetical protein
VTALRTTWKPDKEIKLLVGCSLPKAKDIHDAIAAGVLFRALKAG